MVCACIDIGSNTTRVLVADADGRGLREVVQQRVFTRLGRGLRAGGSIPRAKVEELARVVAAQRALAERVGARALRAVATAAVREAANRDEVVAAVRAEGVDLAVLDGDEEARLAFLGATRTLAEPLRGRVGVVDVGGGSTELAVGTTAGGAERSASVAIGSGVLTERHAASDPPSAEAIDAMRADADRALAALAVPAADCAVAVGGSATSLRRLVGPALDDAALERGLAVLGAAPAAEVAARLGLEPQRVRLLPAGIVVLGAAGRRLGRPLEIARGGLREGVLLDMATAAP